MKVRFTVRAHRDLTNIASRIAAESPAAANRVVRAIEQTVQLVASMPGIGRQSARQGAREFPVRGLPYLIVYRQAADMIEVITIFHTSRDPRAK